MVTAEQVQAAAEFLLSAGVDARKGLPDALFYLVSSLTPIPNVDLLIRDGRGRILLAWRDDDFYGTGWHVPGGCIRYGETMAQRIQRTARAEVGCQVEAEPEPLAVRDVVRGPRQGLDNPDVRGHNLTLLFRCRLPEGYRIDNGGKRETDAGFLRWFDRLPENLLAVHNVYRDILEQFMKEAGQ